MFYRSLSLNCYPQKAYQLSLNFGYQALVSKGRSNFLIRPPTWNRAKNEEKKEIMNYENN